MKEDYVSFEIAKLLKEKGFDESCDQKYDDEGYLSFNHIGYINAEKPTEDFSALAPTHQMAMKWLREEHKVFIYVEPFITTSGLEGYNPYCTKIGGEFMWINPLRKYSNTSSDTYEEAVESAIKYCLENLI